MSSASGVSSIISAVTDSADTTSDNFSDLVTFAEEKRQFDKTYGLQQDMFDLEKMLKLAEERRKVAEETRMRNIRNYLARIK